MIFQKIMFDVSYNCNKYHFKILITEFYMLLLLYVLRNWDVCLGQQGKIRKNNKKINDTKRS